MHPTAYAFATSALTGADVAGMHVIEAGSQDVNGSVRPHVMQHGPASYTGYDIAGGPGVDHIRDAADLDPDSADVVVTTEMLEHARDWQAAMRGLIGAVRPGGILVITTRSPGFPYHAYPEDHWRFPVDTMGRIVKAAGLDIERLEPDPDPGVFVKARKPAGWSWPDGMQATWDEVEVPKP